MSSFARFQRAVQDLASKALKSERRRTKGLILGRAPVRGGVPVALLAALIWVGDVLVWGFAPGLGLAVCLCISLVTGLVLGVYRPGSRQWAGAATLAVLCVLPLIELVQPLSVLLAMCGFCAVVALLAPVPATAIWRACARLLWLGPIQSVGDSIRFCQRVGQAAVQRHDLRADLLGWALPIVATLVFAVLLVGANPVLDTWIASLPDWRPPSMDGLRISFWLALASVIWPVLVAHRMADRLQCRKPQRATVKRQGLINAVSVARSLVAFNALFAVQTGMDIAFLYGQVALPDGISPAAYAHRGAYPLLVTALLAGAFAVAARPYLVGRPLVRALMMAWLCQTLALVFASLWRLDLYVEAYGLTRLRLAAFVWMGVVAIGLGITAEQIWRNKPAVWMLRRSAILGIAVLYLCAFISFDRHIATYNLTHDVPEDREVICRLGEAAFPAIVAYKGEHPFRYCRSEYWSPDIDYPDDWREWGFRNWRVRRSVATMQESVRP